MESKYSFQSNEWQNNDVKLWAKGSFEMAKNNVYPDVTPGQALSQAYITKNAEALKKSIVLGGLRLAHTIQYIFGNGEVLPSIEDGSVDNNFLQ